MNTNAVIRALFVVAVLGIFVGYPLVKGVYFWETIDEVEFTVSGRDQVTVMYFNSQGGRMFDSSYLVSTKEGETFLNEDTLFFMKWNSYELQLQLEVGKRFKARVYGGSASFFTKHRNILSITALDQ